MYLCQFSAPMVIFVCLFSLEKFEIKRKTGEGVWVPGVEILLCSTCSLAWTELYFLYFGFICSYLQELYVYITGCMWLSYVV